MLLLTACGGGGKAVAPIGKHNKANIDYATHKQTRPPATYKVKKGDTMYSVSWRYGMDYKTLAAINHIRSPYTLSIGQTLRFKSYKTSTNQTKIKVKTQPKNNSNTATKPTTPKPNTTTQTSANKRLTWRWPTKGKVISTYSKSATSRKGIDIAGKAGQTVVAAASGKVVYAGDGLPRYGNLLIIKHNDAYLSAYAHNKKLLVKEGDYVKSGQKIATLGKTGTQSNQLHFEIRRNGKPVDPLRFLPKR